ncbi:hypothetical protein ACFSF0_04630 [Ottowia flava]|uniref:Uncharacterized protein n=1 Tax=Ottowia flava TaxID=2675430 RepID=A0ABW4KQV6_9BURK|nr:hypothetical protein [Ottowia sp. GY511]
MATNNPQGHNQYDTQHRSNEDKSMQKDGKSSSHKQQSQAQPSSKQDESSKQQQK